MCRHTQIRNRHSQQSRYPDTRAAGDTYLEV